MFKILPTNRFSKAKSYNFHFHKSEHRDLLLQMAYVFRANPCENSRMERATFSKFYLLPGRLQWNAWQTCVPLLTSEQEYLGKWKAPPFHPPSPTPPRLPLFPVKTSSQSLLTNKWTEELCNDCDATTTAGVTAFWASPRFGHPHSQIPSVLGISGGGCLKR